MSVGCDNDRRFFTTLVLLSLGCFVIESILRAYGLPHMPLRFGLKVLATFIGIGVFASLLVRYKADRYSFLFIAIGLVMFVLARAFDVESIHQFCAELLGLSEINFSRIVDNSVQKTGIYCVVLSLVSLIITSAKRRSEAVNEAASRLNVEERLRASETRFRVMFEQSPCPISHVSLEGKHVLVNEKLCDLVGYESEELVGMSVEALIEPEDREEGARAFDQVLFGDHASESCQVRYRHKNGFTIWVKNSICYVDELAVSPAYVIVVSEDVTELRRRMHQLSDSVSLLEATLESTTDGILVVGLEGKITRYNQRYLEMWQIPETILHAMSDEKTISFVMDQLEDPEGFLERVQELYQNVEQESFDLIQFKNGRIFERFSKPQYVEGLAVGRVWSFRDVTDARKAQTAQRRLEVQIRDAQKMEALGTLAGGVAHDFNNILSSIMANTEVAMTLAGESKDVQECLGDIVISCERSRDLISRIVRFTRKGEKQTNPLSLELLLRDAEKLIRPALPASIEIKVSIEPSLPFVEGEPTQFHQILLNLCANAATAIQGRPGRIGIDLELVELEEMTRVGNRDLEAGRFVVVRVSDDGCGMNSDELDRVLEPFYTTKEPGDGSGLGLTVVQGIVKGVRGAMCFTSSVGEGTKVELYFPAVTPSELPAEESHSSGDDAITGAGQRILFLDDEEFVAKSVSKRMHQLNYSLDVYTDSTAALEAFKTNPGNYDLVMTDLTMPGIDGINVAKQVRGISPGFPVILLTGYGDPSIHQLANEAGVSIILKKPVNSSSMSWAVREALVSAGAATVSTRIVN
jgi:two-component system cell cycle sensor histidine kinase/response regulator CckA